MSQPCTAIELLVVDIRALEIGQTKSVVERANELAIACGCLSLEVDGASAVALSNMTEAFDFWFGGDGISLPLERSISFLTTPSPRVMLVSADMRAHAEAGKLGIHSFEPDTLDLERTLG